MSKKVRKSYPPEFKAEAVELAKSGEKSLSQVARDLDLNETSLRQWVVAAEQIKPSRALNTEERAELEKLRRENRTLRVEREILKKAAAFFAKENQ
jgi:transposase